MDGGGDATSFLRLNPAGGGNSADPAWRFVRVADDPGANHTPAGAYAYRNAGPGPNAIYSNNVCAAAETPVLTVGFDHSKSDVLGTSPVGERLGWNRNRVFAQRRSVDRRARAEQFDRRWMHGL